MNAIICSVHLHLNREGNTKSINRVDFYFNKVLVISYTSLLEEKFDLDLDNRKIITSLRSFSYSKKKDITSFEYEITMIRRRYLSLLFFCQLSLEYDCNLTENDEMDEIASIIKQLYE